MSFDRLEKNLIDNVREAQIKLGYDRRPMSLNYMLASLDHLTGTELDAERMQVLLSDFSADTAPRLGGVTFRPIKDGFCITVPAEGTAYVHEHSEGAEFITDFIETVRRHDITFDDVLAVFRKYSDNVTVEESNNEEFDYLVYFSDGAPDDYIYCISVEEELGGGQHITYHRFIREDYEELGF